MVKSYLRYAQQASWGVVVSGGGQVAVDASGKLAVAPAPIPASRSQTVAVVDPPGFPVKSRWGAKRAWSRSIGISQSI